MNDLKPDFTGSSVKSAGLLRPTVRKWNRSISNIGKVMILTFSMFVYFHPAPVHADCCYCVCCWECEGEGEDQECDFIYCDDCTGGTPYCGNGECNIFGCNCDDGCRSTSQGCEACSCPAGATHTKDAPPPVKITPLMKFRQVDTNKNGEIDFEETMKWVQKRDKNADEAKTKQAFEKMDLNHDGIITPDEFDTDLKTVKTTDITDNQTKSDSISMNTLAIGGGLIILAGLYLLYSFVFRKS